MAETTGPYAVTQVTVRESPRLDARGSPCNAVILSFMVGPSGPFTVVYPDGQPTVDQMTADITAKVNALRQLDTNVATINSQM